MSTHGYSGLPVHDRACRLPERAWTGHCRASSRRVEGNLPGDCVQDRHAYVPVWLSGVGRLADTAQFSLWTRPMHRPVTPCCVVEFLDTMRLSWIDYHGEVREIPRTSVRRLISCERSRSSRLRACLRHAGGSGQHAHDVVEMGDLEARLVENSRNGSLTKMMGGRYDWSRPASPT